VAKAIKWTFERPFFVKYRKHYCPICGDLLSVEQKRQIVNSKSDEAKNFDFQHVDIYLSGDVEFRWNVFRCTGCRREFTIKEIWRDEKAKHDYN
jgi:rRNA maturation endonuclease Nob1